MRENVKWTPERRLPGGEFRDVFPEKTVVLPVIRTHAFDFAPETVGVVQFDPMSEFVDDHDSLEEITFGYCTEFIVSHPRPEMRDSDVVRLRKRLEKLGDCVLVISDLSVVKVHVHTNDPGKALQYALELGELDAIKIDNMFEEHRERMAKLAAEEAAKQKPYGIVCVALGNGIVDIFK